MTATEIRRTKAAIKEPVPPSNLSTRTLTLDAGNYDLKFWDGNSHPRAIRSIR